MILYHGTTVEIEEIDLQKSKPNKDFRKELSDNFAVLMQLSEELSLSL